jgi:hypothetical protein
MNNPSKPDAHPLAQAGSPHRWIGLAATRSAGSHHCRRNHPDVTGDPLLIDVSGARRVGDRARLSSTAVGGT